MLLGKTYPELKGRICDFEGSSNMSGDTVFAINTGSSEWNSLLNPKEVGQLPEYFSKKMEWMVGKEKKSWKTNPSWQRRNRRITAVERVLCVLVNLPLTIARFRVFSVIFGPKDQIEVSIRATDIPHRPYRQPSDPRFHSATLGLVHYRPLREL